MKATKQIFIIAGGVLVVALATLAAFGFLRPYSFHGAVMQSPRPADDFTLTASSGQPASLSDFHGKLVLLYFGYTFCPDVCPATLSEVTRAVKLLGDKAEKVQVIMISVDPLRDTPDKLGEYMQHFSPAYLGLTGTEDEIARVAAMYGVFFEKHEGSAASGYLVDHTATVTVIDQKGYVKLIFPFGTPGADIAADLEYMLR